MEQSTEAIHQIDDYFGFPLRGIADFRGVPHRFQRVGWLPRPEDAADETSQWQWFSWFFADDDPSESQYELVPLDGPSEVTAWTRATFHGAELDAEPPADISTIRVTWRPVPIQERLDYILESQHWVARICVWFCLSREDLKAIEPDLRPRDTELPDFGEIGLYRGLRVLSLGSWPIAGASSEFYQGVRFAYVQCLAVD